MFVHLFQIILNFLYVSQSVSWFTSLLKLDKYRDISSSGSDIFLKFFWGIPGMLVHLFQIILIFLFVCQSVIWLTFLLKLHKCRECPVLGDISFWTFLETIQGNFWTIAMLFWISCMSVSMLVGLVPYWKYTNIGISPVLDKISVWHFLEAFLWCWYTCSI